MTERAATGAKQFPFTGRKRLRTITFLTNAPERACDRKGVTDQEPTRRITRNLLGISVLASLLRPHKVVSSYFTDATTIIDTPTLPLISSFNPVSYLISFSSSCLIIAWSHTSCTCSFAKTHQLMPTVLRALRNLKFHFFPVPFALSK